MIKSKKGVKQFNMLIVGTGGQGLITLLRIISQAAADEGQEIKTSELHGLSQRGGSVQVHIRFGEKIYSPLIQRQKADLVLALEAQESLNGVYFADAKTNFLINQFFVPIPFQKTKTEEEIKKELAKITKNITFVPADKICLEKLKNSVVSGVYLMSLAVFSGRIPLKPNSILCAIKKVIPAQYLELNEKAFDLAKLN
jgi:indolepyruvate ferredoxin oxidoreductase, beta subunit